MIKGYRPVIPVGTSPALASLIMRCWHVDPDERPTADMVVGTLQQCWGDCVYSVLAETEFKVDSRIIADEHFKLSIQPTNVASASAGGSSAYCVSGLPSSRKHVNASPNELRRHSVSICSTNSGAYSATERQSIDDARRNRTFSSSRSASFHLSSNMMVSPVSISPYNVRPPPSSALIDSLMQMQRESRWQRFEDFCEGVLVLTPEPPYCILWATKKWTLLTGYLLNEVLALDVDVLTGARTDKRRLRGCFDVAKTGQVAHIVVSVFVFLGVICRL